MKRNASANWQGTGKEGKGNLTTQSTVLNKTQYSFSSRFEEGVGTNPEELIAAAHAGCFSMKLSFNLNKAGFTAENIDTKCVINLEAAVGAITDSNLTVSAKVPGISKEQFDDCVADAEINCPVSKLLKATITVTANLV